MDDNDPRYDPYGECPECVSGGTGPICDECQAIDEEDEWEDEE